MATLAQRARARAESRAGWANVGTQSTAAAAPAPTTAEFAAEAFKAPMLASMRQELHDVSRSLLRTEDKLRAAERRATFLQEHNAALLALVPQAVAPAGIGEHEFIRPSGWRERALRVLAQAWPDA